MAIPTTRVTLIEYCLRQLGAPVLEINIDDDQISDRVDEAFQWYQAFHSDAVTRTYRVHQITATDVTNKYITLPDGMIYVYGIMPLSSYANNGLFSADYQFRLNDFFALGRMPDGLISYEMGRQHLSTLGLLLTGSSQEIRFSRHQNILRIDVDWAARLPEGSYVVIDGQNIVDPNTSVEVYNDRTLKLYLTALLKKQWGQNLIKFGGMVLPGGITINGREIYTDAMEEILKIETETRLVYESPADFYIG